MKRRLSVFACAAVLSFGAVSNVAAQDILRAMRSPPVASWTGFYAGGNFGYGWARDASMAEASTGGQASSSFKMNGLSAGGQIGGNIQYYGPWVAGLESDIQASWQKFDGPPGGNLSNLNSAAGFAAPTTERVSIDWFGTTRGRLGYSANTVLVYGTAGVAYAQFKTTGGSNGFQQINSAPVRFGWTAGGGVEAMIGRNFSVKGEYLHMDFSAASDDFAAGTIRATLHQRVTNDLVRVGVNYFFR